jgi:RHH-type proline utilization regulon transcriptional repressor/proline dehydrogenase/delta 1-pyrroline-5-carboxylate dehydrogenase
VVDAQQHDSVKAWQEIAAKEGEIVLKVEAPAGGYFVGPTIVTGIRPEHRVAREEIFGPLLAIMRAGDFDGALAVANATMYGLTGGVYTRSPAHIERARREFRVGNLYINRPITGAKVGRQPFGGSRMSGVGSKAGGPVYLLQFLEPRTITENTVRRGFSPELV